MKILFKNTTKYTKKNRDNFLKFHSNKYRRKELTRIILFAICILYILVSNILYKNWLLVIVAVLFGVIGYLILQNKLKNEEKNKNKIKEFTFYFYEKHIKIKYKRSFERLKYFQLHKIFETSEYFFLYLDERNSLILSKEGFEVGTPKTFSAFIKNKCPLKYKNEAK